MPVKTHSTYNFTDKVPKNYHTLLAPLFEPYAIKLAEQVSSVCLGSGAKVLELACGTGRVTKQLLLRLPAGSSLHATDSSVDMLKEAESHATETDVLRSEVTVRYAAVDMNSIPFDDATFDAVVVAFGLMFCEDRSHVYNEVKRVLRPGGTLHFSLWGQHENNPYSDIVNDILMGFVAKSGKLDTVESPMEVPFSMWDGEAVKTHLQQCGYENVVICDDESMRMNGEWDGVTQMVQGYTLGTPLADTLRLQGVEVDEDSWSKQMTAAFTERFASTEEAAAGGKVLVPMHAIMGMARKPAA